MPSVALPMLYLTNTGQMQFAAVLDTIHLKRSRCLSRDNDTALSFEFNFPSLLHICLPATGGDCTVIGTSATLPVQ
jgi:hypothetical protein